MQKRVLEQTGSKLYFFSRHHLQVNLVSHDRHHFSETKSSRLKFGTWILRLIQISPPFHVLCIKANKLYELITFDV
jgi:hypothetical protein